jgi:hypothetical protein
LFVSNTCLPRVGLREQKITEFTLIRAPDFCQRQSLHQLQTAICAEVFEHFFETFSGLHTSPRGSKISNRLCSPIDFYKNFFVEAKLSFEGHARHDIAIFGNGQRRVEQSGL